MEKCGSASYLTLIVHVFLSPRSSSDGLLKDFFSFLFFCIFLSIAASLALSAVLSSLQVTFFGLHTFVSLRFGSSYFCHIWSSLPDVGTAHF